MKNIQDISMQELQKKIILIRADLDAPRNTAGDIEDDFRLQETLKTIHFLKQLQCSLILIGHAGNPKLSADGTPSLEDQKKLSLKPLVNWFKVKGIHTQFAATVKQAHELSRTTQSFVILENLRFFPGEKENNFSFAQSLHTLGTYFVQDAFAAMHRNDCSIVTLPKLYPESQRAFGISTFNALQTLDQVINNKQNNITYIVGGAKIQTKLPLIEKLLTNGHTVLVTPPLCFTFMRAMNQEVGASLIDEAYIPLAKKIITLAKEYNYALQFPIDFTTTKETFQNPANISIVRKLTSNDTGISFGPETVTLFEKYLQKTDVIILNGPQGNVQFPETALYFKNFLKIIMNNRRAVTIITGGDTLAALHHMHFGTPHCITLSGGGATLSYSAFLTLPGLEAMMSDNSMSIFL